jgi:arginase
MIELIGVPFDLTGKHLGSRMGPEALRLAGLVETLEKLGEKVKDLDDLPKQRESTAPDGIRNFEPLLSCLTELKSKVAGSIKKGNTPIVMGGDHAISIGSVSGALSAHKKLALLWVDAHADVNTPKTSPSGNAHGMPVGALFGLPSGLKGVKDQQWNKLLQAMGPARLSPNRTAWYGLREVDFGERPHTEKPSFTIAMDAIDREGLGSTVEKFHQWMVKSGSTHLWISFDCDCIDPVFAPGTGTAVRGGLTYREAHLLAELLYQKLNASKPPYKLAGIDLMEVNPIRDTTNMTAAVTVEWAASLFGKTILGKR